MRNQVTTIPGANWWANAEWALTGLASQIPQLHVGRYLRESALLLGAVALMAIPVVGTIVLVACTVAEAVAGAQ
jgi:hypothetical protein